MDFFEDVVYVKTHSSYVNKEKNDDILFGGKLKHIICLSDMELSHESFQASFINLS